MPIPFAITAISGNYPDIAVNKSIVLFLRTFYIFIGIFYPSGEPISPHLLRCGLFAVDDHSFTGPRLASVAISTHE